MNFLDCDANFKREQISWLKPFVVEIISETETSTRLQWPDNQGKGENTVENKKAVFPDFFEQQLQIKTIFLTTLVG